MAPHSKTKLSLKKILPKGNAGLIGLIFQPKGIQAKETKSLSLHQLVESFFKKKKKEQQLVDSFRNHCKCLFELWAKIST